MGEVYRARDTRLQRDVAIKTLPPRGDLSRFRTEARALAALNHPKIVAIFDAGDDYLVTELVDGKPLGPAGLAKSLDLAAQVADGLAAAHSIGITHRDLKPGNILVTRDGRVKIIDFGLAKSTEAPGPDAPTLTAEGAVMGTVAYMSPEQIRGERVDARSDIFSFGIVLYELLAGQRPFQGESAPHIMTAILDKEPPELNEQIAVPLRQIVFRCLAKDREQRFQSARDLAFALRSLGGFSESVSRSSVTATAPLPVHRNRFAYAFTGAGVLVGVLLTL